MRNETYLRMLILLLPFVDFHFCSSFQYNKKELESKILLYLKYHGHIENVDIAKNIISFYYDKKNYDVDDFIEILEKISKSLLTYHNDHIMVDIFTKPANYNDVLSPFHNKILPFVEINRLISDDLLTAIYNFKNNYELEYILENDLVKPISVVNYQLEMILNKGLAENHTHLFGSIPFEVQWGWLMDKLSNNKYIVVQNMLKKLDDSSINSGVQYHKDNLQINASLGNIILYTSLIRILMLNFLVLEYGKKDFNFRKYIGYQCKFLNFTYSEEKYLETIINSFYNCKFESNDKNYILHFGLVSKITSNDDNYYENMFKNCVSLKSTEILKNKFKINRFSIKSDYNLMEFIFLYKSYEYICNHNDKFFKEIFFQYFRYKNVFHTLINQSSDIKGFFEFQMYFKSQHSLINTASTMFTPIFQTYAYENVKYLEIRIGHIRTSNKALIPTDILKTMKNTFYKFVNAYLNHLQTLEDDNVVKAGVILHFNKRNDVYAGKCWYDFMTYDNKMLLNYERYREECFINLIALVYLRGEIKGADKFIIGIDAASNELLTEPWVLAPIFKSVKDKWHDILVKKMDYYDVGSYKRSSPLGITYHVGEVFNSIVSGLRHVDEVIEHYGFQSGERLGHATILGIDTDRYSKEKKVITLSVIELLDNWLWIYHIKAEKNLFKDISPTFVENKIYDLIHIIYGDINGHIHGEISIHNLYQAYLMQFDDNKINKNFYKQCNLGEKGYPCYFAEEKNPWSSTMLFYTRHCSCYLKKMNKFVQMEIDNDFLRCIYKEAQAYLLQKIANKGIIVEVNPISNSLIGDMDYIFDHPIIKINDTYKDNSNYNHVMTTINTDNPGVFSTTLSNQFGFIEQLLIDRGYSKEQALQWIDRIRENGLNSTFIQYKKMSKKDIIRELEYIKKQLDENI